MTPDEELVERWNLAHPEVGIPVQVTLDNGSIVCTRTRSDAYVMGRHTAVIFLEPCPAYQFTGCYSLDRVRAIDTGTPQTLEALTARVDYLTSRLNDLSARVAHDDAKFEALAADVARLDTTLALMLTH